MENILWFLAGAAVTRIAPGTRAVILALEGGKTFKQAMIAGGIAFFGFPTLP